MVELNQIITGETYEVLSSLDNDIFHLGITSPPYNKMGARGGLVKAVKYDQADDCLPESEYQHRQILVLDELFRVIKPGGSLFYNHRTRYVDGIVIHPIEWLVRARWQIRQEIIWNREFAGNLQGWRFWPIEERIYWLYKPIGEKDKVKIDSKHAKLTSIWRIRPEFSNAHPAPYPVEIPTRIIYSMLDDEKGCAIIDPYIGSGTTAVVAKYLGHKYLGIDMSEKYCETANERINNISMKEIERIEAELSLHSVDVPYALRKKVVQKFASLAEY